MKTLFFTFGITLTVAALVFSFGLLRLKKFPSGPAMVGVIALFVVLVGGTTTFAVGYANHEKAEREENAEHATQEEAENAEEQSSGTDSQDQPSGSTTQDQIAKGPGGTVKLTADPTQLAYDTTTLSSKPGKVTIDFTNPSTIPHDVAIEKSGEEIAVSDEITGGATTSVSANLEPGTYTFLCTVPGHAEAGMQGTLTVK